jgi:hypothetical protein
MAGVFGLTMYVGEAFANAEDFDVECYGDNVY